ncbi:hypothetical protein VCHC32A1_3261, partial [Vibrio cholerae HC-32A1]
MVSVVVFGFG